MRYNFKCDCGKTKTINCKMSEVKNMNVICDCGKNMFLEFSSHLIVPEHMKAASITEMTNLNSCMKNLPSGKRKVIY